MARSSGAARLRLIFLALGGRAVKSVPKLKDAALAACPEADAENKASARQYMHTGHRPHTVCYAGATLELPAEVQAGLVAHEIGHLVFLALGLEHTERDADNYGGSACGVVVRREPPLDLEVVRPLPPWLREEAGL